MINVWDWNRNLYISHIDIEEKRAEECILARLEEPKGHITAKN